VTLTAGSLDTTRALIAGRLVAALGAHGLQARLVETSSTEESLAGVDRGAIDFALVSGAFRIERYPRVRAITPLYVEALHLLVKEDLADDVGRGLDALHGHTVDLGPRGSATAGLATAVLDFAGVAPRGTTATDGYVARFSGLDELLALLERGDRAALPDAVLHLATVPSRSRWGSSGLAGTGSGAAVRRGFPAGRAAGEDRPAPERSSAGTSPTRSPRSPRDRSSVPARAHDRSQLTLVANDRVPAGDRARPRQVFSASSQVTSPPLDPSVLALPSHADLHPGAIDYLRRDKPYVTDDTVNALSNSLSILGALAGGGLFLWQWWRQRTRARRDETFGAYMLRVADVERRIAALELSATLELEPLAELQRELLELKSEALDRFAVGDLGDQAALSDLLTPINAARDHIGNLILHIRDNLEERADAEGRTANSLWSEAIAKPEGTGGRG
jgi:hypothetical protein